MDLAWNNLQWLICHKTKSRVKDEKIMYLDYKKRTCTTLLYLYFEHPSGKKIWLNISLMWNAIHVRLVSTICALLIVYGRIKITPLPPPRLIGDEYFIERHVPYACTVDITKVVIQHKITDATTKNNDSDVSDIIHVLE